MVMSPPLIKSEMNVYKLCLSALHRPDHLRPAFDLSEEATERERENKKKQMMKKTAKLRCARKRKRVVTLVAYIRTQLSLSFSLSLSLHFYLYALLCLTRRHSARSCRDVNGSQTYATFPQPLRCLYVATRL